MTSSGSGSGSSSSSSEGGKEEKLSMKLLIDKRSNKVLFAETTKDVIDFLVGILSLPMATISGALDPGDPLTPGSMANLCSSFDSFDEDYLEFNPLSEQIFPELPHPLPAVVPLWIHETPQPVSKVYRCPCSSTYTSRVGQQAPDHICNSLYFSDVRGTISPSCKRKMTIEMTNVASKVKKEVPCAVGFVKELVAYMVTDDLIISPLSLASVISVLKKCNAEDISQHEYRTVELGPDERLKMLTEAVRSKSVLTNVFVGGETGEAPAVP